MLPEEPEELLPPLEPEELSALEPLLPDVLRFEWRFAFLALLLPDDAPDESPEDACPCDEACCCDCSSLARSSIAEIFAGSVLSWTPLEAPELPELLDPMDPLELL